MHSPTALRRSCQMIQTISMRKNKARPSGTSARLPLLLLCICFVSLLDCSAPRRSIHTANQWTAKKEKDENVPVVLVSSMIKDLDEVSMLVWQGLGEYCSNDRARYIINILYKTGNRRAGPGEHYLKDCEEVSLVQQDSIVDLALARWPKEKEKWQNLRGHWKRIDKLVMLRSWQRTFLSMPYAGKVDAVVVVDLDAIQLPSEQGLQAIIGEIYRDGSQKEAGVIQSNVYCANGYEYFFFKKVYYDSFAFVDAQGRWGYYNPLLVARYQHRFAHEQVKMHTCFGGVAVYDARAYFIPECNYYDTNRTTNFTDIFGFSCEHVLFQECLRDHLGDGNIRTVIDPRLDYSRALLFLGMERGNLLNKLLLLVVMLVGLKATTAVVALFDQRRARHKNMHESDQMSVPQSDDTEEEDSLLINVPGQRTSAYYRIRSRS